MNIVIRPPVAFLLILAVALLKLRGLSVFFVSAKGGQRAASARPTPAARI